MPAANGIVATTITNGGTTTPTLPLANARPIGIELPASFEGTALTFNAAIGSGANGAAGTMLPLYDSAGNRYTVVVGASRRVILNPADFYGIQFLQIISGTVVGADRAINLVLEGY